MTYIHRSAKKNIKFIKTVSTTEHKPGTSYATIPGSTIEYTPISGCDHVVYDFTTYYGADMGYAVTAGFRTRLQIGDSDTSLGDIVTNNDNYTYGEGATINSGVSKWRRPLRQHAPYFRFVIPLSEWPKDSSNRLKKQTLVLQAKKYLNVTYVMLHGTSYDDWSYTDSETLHFDPFLLVYCV